jgi:hypothetical protein
MSSKGIVLLIVLAVFCFCIGCVERKLTIVTEPSGALVALNDEEIGISPVTVAFEWYGDYSVRISKDGCRTLNTHQNLKRPLKDKFPFDLLADMFTTKIDEYTWSFKLEPNQPIQKDELIKAATALRKEALIDPNAMGDKKPPAKKPKPAEKKKH